MHNHLGIKEVKFDSWLEFNSWKEKEEEKTHTHYIKEKNYKPLNSKEGTGVLVFLTDPMDLPHNAIKLTDMGGDHSQN